MLKCTKALEIPMANQAVNRVVAGNSEEDKGWQKTVVRHLTEHMAISAPLPTEGRPAPHEPASATVPDQTDAIAIIQRVSGLSIGELDKTIHELQKVRAFLVSEEERIRREMADYLKLTHAAINSTKTMAESIAHFGSVLGDAGKRSDP
jgi:hypothetical protein